MVGAAPFAAFILTTNGRGANRHQGDDSRHFKPTAFG
jgi:hypothetical protein